MSLSTIIKIAIADDHKIFRDGIKMALNPKDRSKNDLGSRRRQRSDAQNDH